jgi:hypothetical protein
MRDKRGGFRYFRKMCETTRNRLTTLGPFPLRLGASSKSEEHVQKEREYGVVSLLSEQWPQDPNTFAQDPIWRV